MKLKYKIIWFEDSDEEYGDMSSEVKTFLKEKAFEPEIHQEKTDDNLTKILAQKDIDLIIMDYKLARGKKGDDLIRAIRGYDIYTEILFYSVDYPGTDGSYLDEKLKGVDGIFYERRQDLVEKAKKVINLTLRKIEDLNNMRGLVLAEVSCMDGKIKEILQNHISKLSFEEKEILREDIKKRIIEHLQSKIGSAEKIESVDEFLDKIFFELNLKWRSLKRIIEELKEGLGLESHLEQLNLLSDEVFQKRNLLAHIEEEIINGERVLKGKEEFIFNEKECVLIRKAILKHQDNLEEINKKIKERKNETPNLNTKL